MPGKRSPGKRSPGKRPRRPVPPQVPVAAPSSAAATQPAPRPPEFTHDTLTRTLHSIQIGCRAVEEFSRVMVRMAVEDALLCVARDFGHDYSALLRRYRDEVVHRHVSGAMSDKTTCAGTTKHGKRCANRGEIQGYCRVHAAQMADEACKRRKVEAYTTRVGRALHDDHDAMLWLLGERRETATALPPPPAALTP